MVATFFNVPPLNDRAASRYADAGCGFVPQEFEEANAGLAAGSYDKIGTS